MGQAKARGTREQRVAQAIERRKEEDAAASERYRQQEAERRARIAALPPAERKEVILAGPGHGPRLTATMLALALGASAPMLIVGDKPPSGDSSR